MPEGQPDGSASDDHRRDRLATVQDPGAGGPLPDRHPASISARFASLGSVVEGVSKAAALISIACIVGLQFTLQPGVTWPLRLVMALALAAGVVAGRVSPQSAPAFLLVFVPIAPVVLAKLTGASDPVHHTVWMVALAGCVVHRIPLLKWAFPEGWRALAGGWALTLSLAWPVLVARESGFDLSRLFDTSSVNSWALMTTAQVTGWILHVVLAHLVGLLWLEWLMTRGRADWPATLPRAAHGLWIGATLSSLVAIYQGTIDLAFLSNSQWASLGRAPGSMLDANGYGVVAALAGPLAVIAIPQLRLRSGPMIATAVLAINWIGLWMSGSRTALLCGVIGTGFLVSGLARAGRPGRAVVSGVAGIVGAAILVTALQSGATGPLTRLADLTGGDATDLTQALFTRRGYSEVSVRMIREHPLTGVGVGTYHWLAPDYWRVMKDEALPFDNAQNWWRHQVAELGVIGAVPLLIWSAMMAGLVFGRSSGRARFPDTVTLRGLVLGVGLISLLGMPTGNPVTLLWFLSLVALLATSVAAPNFRVSSWLAAPVVWPVVAALAILYAGGQLVLALGALDVAARATQSNRDYAVGVYEPESLPDGGEFRWTRQDAHLVWVKSTPWVVVRTWVGHPDVAQRPVGLRLSTPCQIVFDGNLQNSTPTSVGLLLPPDYGPLSLSIHVSRTWRPSRYGSQDPRTLGAALAVTFEEDCEPTTPVEEVVQLQACGESTSAH